MNSHGRLILCSKSKGRAAILRAANIEFEMKEPSIREEMQLGETPIGMVRRLAYCKAQAVAISEAPCLAIGADTIILNDKQQILGKPGSRKRAIEMLKELSGRVHQVLTGIALIGADFSVGNVAIGHNITNVTFKTLKMSQIQSYVDACKTVDKAGAYAIQCRGSDIIKHVEGCWTNIVGLPFGVLGALYFNEMSVSIIERIPMVDSANPALFCLKNCSLNPKLHQKAICPFSQVF
ncbi:MAG: Maf family protein [Candidatus Hodarchaeota archaeon]